MLLPHSGAVDAFGTCCFTYASAAFSASATLTSDAWIFGSSPDFVCISRTKSPMRASVSASACTMSSMPSSSALSDASVTMHAISTITSVSTIRPVISRSTQTRRSSTADTPAAAASRLAAGELVSGTRRTLPAHGARVDSRPMSAPPVVWRPDAELLSNSNVARFMAAEGIADFPALVARSIDEPEWFWDATVRFLGIRFSKPYERVLDTSDGIPWAKWFVGGRCNIAETCVDQWSGRDDSGDVAVVWEGEDGATREL